jgi:hypothetical protein
VKTTKQKKTMTSTLQKKKTEAKQAQKQSYNNENKGKKTTYEGGQTSCMRTMITTHQKKVAKQNKTIAL